VQAAQLPDGFIAVPQRRDGALGELVVLTFAGL
jgi:hypothetical protein